MTIDFSSCCIIFGDKICCSREIAIKLVTGYVPGRDGKLQFPESCAIEQIDNIRLTEKRLMTAVGRALYTSRQGPTLNEYGLGNTLEEAAPSGKFRVFCLLDDRKEYCFLLEFFDWADSEGVPVPLDLREQVLQSETDAEILSVGRKRADNFDYWKSRQLWTLIEAAYLLAGLEPVAPRAFDPNANDLSGKIYRDLKDAIDRKKIKFVESRTGYLNNRRVEPADCVVWARKRGHEIPTELAGIAKDAPEDRRARREQIAKRSMELETSGVHDFLQRTAKEFKISVSRVKQIREKVSGRKAANTKFANLAVRPWGKTTPHKS